MNFWLKLNGVSAVARRHFLLGIRRSRNHRSATTWRFSPPTWLSPFISPGSMKRDFGFENQIHKRTSQVNRHLCGPSSREFIANEHFRSQRLPDSHHSWYAENGFLDYRWHLRSERLRTGYDAQPWRSFRIHITQYNVSKTVTSKLSLYTVTESLDFGCGGAFPFLLWQIVTKSCGWIVLRAGLLVEGTMEVDLFDWWANCSLLKHGRLRSDQRRLSVTNHYGENSNTW